MVQVFCSSWFLVFFYYIVSASVVLRSVLSVFVIIAITFYHLDHFFKCVHDIDYNSQNSQHSTDHFSTYVEFMKNKYTKKMFPSYLNRSEFSLPEHKTINLVLVDKEMG